MTNPELTAATDRLNAALEAVKNALKAQEDWRAARPAAPRMTATSPIAKIQRMPEELENALTAARTELNEARIAYEDVRYGGQPKGGRYAEDDPYAAFPAEFNPHRQYL